MKTPELYITPRGAAAAGEEAVRAKRARRYEVRPHVRRNPDDRSVERGFIVLLF